MELFDRISKQYQNQVKKGNIAAPSEQAKSAPAPVRSERDALLEALSKAPAQQVEAPMPIAEQPKSEIFSVRPGVDTPEGVISVNGQTYKNGQIWNRENESSPSRAPASSGFDLNALMVGATPALIGLLTGEREAGFGIASDALGKYENDRIALMKERMAAKNKTINDPLEAVDVDGKPILKRRSQAEGMQKYYAPPKESSTGRRYQIKAVEDTTTGEIKYVNYDTFTGEIQPTDKLAGYRKNVRVDPRDGQLAVTGGARGEVSPIVDETKNARDKSKFNVRQSDEIQKSVQQMLTSDSYKRAKGAKDAAQSALAVISSKNPIGDATSGTLMLRMLGEVGAFTDREKAQAGGSRALEAKIDQMWQTAKTGKFTDTNRKDLLEIAKLLDNLAANRIKRTAGSYIESLKAREGFDPTSAFSPYVEGNEDYYGEEVRKTKKNPPKDPMLQVKDVEEMSDAEVLEQLYKVYPQ